VDGGWTVTASADHVVRAQAGVAFRPGLLTVGGAAFDLIEAAMRDG
jgi:hypothetical protein